MANYVHMLRPFHGFGDFYSGGSLDLSYSTPSATDTSVDTTPAYTPSGTNWTQIATTAINASAQVASSALGPGGIAGQQLPIGYQGGVTLPSNTVAGSASSSILILAGIAVVALLVMKKS